MSAFARFQNACSSRMKPHFCERLYFEDGKYLTSCKEKHAGYNYADCLNDYKRLDNKWHGRHSLSHCASYIPSMSNSCCLFQETNSRDDSLVSSESTCSSINPSSVFIRPCDDLSWLQLLDWNQCNGCTTLNSEEKNFNYQIMDLSKPEVFYPFTSFSQFKSISATVSKANDICDGNVIMRDSKSDKNPERLPATIKSSNLSRKQKSSSGQNSHALCSTTHPQTVSYGRPLNLFAPYGVTFRWHVFPTDYNQQQLIDRPNVSSQGTFDEPPTVSTRRTKPTVNRVSCCNYTELGPSKTDCKQRVEKENLFHQLHQAKKDVNTYENYSTIWFDGSIKAPLESCPKLASPVQANSRLDHVTEQNWHHDNQINRLNADAYDDDDIKAGHGCLRCLKYPKRKTPKQQDDKDSNFQCGVPNEQQMVSLKNSSCQQRRSGCEFCCVDQPPTNVFDCCRQGQTAQNTTEQPSESRLKLRSFNVYPESSRSKLNRVFNCLENPDTVHYSSPRHTSNGTTRCSSQLASYETDSGKSRSCGNMFQNGKPGGGRSDRLGDKVVKMEIK